MSTWFPDAQPITPMERYRFDLEGFIIIRQAIDADHLTAINHRLDQLQHLGKGDWDGHVHGHDYGGREGLNLQQIYEAGPAFERLIDHPAWIEKVRTFVGGEQGFDYLHGPLFIDECFANIREAGEAIGLHSGGQDHVLRTQYAVHNGQFHCGQVNVLMAFNDIGPGDGATMVVPGSHKANFRHPQLEEQGMAAGQARSADGVAGAIEVHLQAGDALLFVDAIMHGSAARTRPGQRRIAVYRYGPSWGNFRHGYRPSAALLDRLTPTRRAIVQPKDPVRPPAACLA